MRVCFILFYNWKLLRGIEIQSKLKRKVKLFHIKKGIKPDAEKFNIKWTKAVSCLHISIISTLNPPKDAAESLSTSFLLSPCKETFAGRKGCEGLLCTVFNFYSSSGTEVAEMFITSWKKSEKRAGQICVTSFVSVLLEKKRKKDTILTIKKNWFFFFLIYHAKNDIALTINKNRFVVLFEAYEV